MMRVFLLYATLFCAAFSFCCPAAAQDNVFLYGNARDFATKELKGGVEAVLMTAERVPLDTMWTKVGNQAVMSLNAWYFSVPREERSYVVQLSCPGYETECLAIDFKLGNSPYYNYGTTTLYAEGTRPAGKAAVTHAALVGPTDEAVVMGNVYDKETKASLVGAHVVLMKATDRKPIAAMRTGERSMDEGYANPWRFNVPCKACDYIVQISCKGYETEYLSIRFKPMQTGPFFQFYGTLPLSRTGGKAASTAERPLEVVQFNNTLNPLLYGQVRDFITDEVKKGVDVELQNADGICLGRMKSGGSWNKIVETIDPWCFYVPRQDAQYVVKFSCEGYETKYLPVRFRPSGRKRNYDFGIVKLRRARKEKKLGEATVRATKVKFYMKEDTLVYNADAFQLAEGSMLDALVRQLPGVELKDDGRIFVNGKFVESLLLNGEDFFRGDNTVMLENLPAYMVKDVKVYDKSGDLSEFMGRKVTGDEEYVMDVRLKRQYSVGWIGNVEGGMGTADRYLGRLFALRFTPQSRLSVYGNLNNVNESRKPGTSGQWSPSNMPVGLDATKTGGVDYMVKDKRRRYELSGNAQATHLDRDNYSRTSQTNFLEGGDTWSERMSQILSCNTTVTTSHSWKFNWEKTMLIVNPNFRYGKYRNWSQSASATFDADPSDIAGLMDSILRPEVGGLLRRMAVNRSRTEYQVDGQNWSASLPFHLFQNFNRSDDVLQLSGNVKYQDSRMDRYDHYAVDYPNSADYASTRDFRNRYYRDRPNQNWEYELTAYYRYWFPFNMCIFPSYRYYGANRRHDYGLFRLDELGAGWGEDAPLGVLPSVTDWMDDTYDANNSYRRRLDESEHTPALNMTWEGKTGNRGQGYTKVFVELPVRIPTHHLDYRRAALDTAFSRTAVLFEPSFNIEHYWRNRTNSLEFTYRRKGNLVNATSLLPIRSDDDPLNITLGNPGLRDSYNNSLSLTYGNRNSGKQRFLNVSAGYTVTEDQQAMGYVYNRATGVRTYRMDNVNGNYSLTGGVNYQTPLDRQKRLTLSTNTDASFYHNVDLIGVETDGTAAYASPERSTVRTLWLGETLKLDYRYDWLKLGAKASAAWRGAQSDRPDFERVSAVDFNYGLTAQVELPAGFQLYTDLTMYSRRGYDASEMNTNELVWNARLSKPLWKNRLTVMVDGFDILGQLSNVTHVLNGQGRTETFRKALPRYAMVHLVYRLNVKPKKRPGDE